jgi:NDP-4-keto-2,6-dideoxyhexose 3-C-methyltransferase
LTGVFPKNREQQLTRGPLTLVKCAGTDNCGLLQLAHSYSLDEMYGANYGYRSGLNPSMVAHLRGKVERIKSLGIIRDGDVIVDIGSNDATTLKQYALERCKLVGVDPTGRKFRQFYTDNIQLVPDFFSAEAFKALFGGHRARVVTSFSMFYDLEDPIAFMREVAELLCDDGIWVLEQSYMPSMLATNAYDTVCHEHLEYYALAQILWMTERAGLKVVDVEVNDVNGGSFSVLAQKISGPLKPTPAVGTMIEFESSQRLDDLATYESFASRVRQSKSELVTFLREAREARKKVAALGASTKGNVVLQYCDIDASLIYAVGEINPDKFGALTPGTHISIVDEREILAGRPDYVLVLPWHFRKFFDSQPKYADLNLVYPLPRLSRHRRFFFIEPSKVKTQHITLIDGYLRALTSSALVAESTELLFCASRSTFNSLSSKMRLTVRHHPIPVMNPEKRRLVAKSILEFLVVLWYMVRMRKDDIVFVSCILPPAFLALELANRVLRRRGVHIVLHGEIESLFADSRQRVGSIGYWTSKWIHFRQPCSMLRLVVIDDFIKQRLLDRFPRILKTEQIFVIHHPISTVAASATTSGSKPTVCFIGYRTALKGFDCFKRLSAMTPTADFIAIGGGRVESMSDARVTQLPGSEDYFLAIGSCSVALFPYVGGYTCSLSAAVLDALSTGVHILATPQPCFISLKEHLGPEVVTTFESVDEAARLMRDPNWFTLKRAGQRERLRLLNSSKYGVDAVRASFDQLMRAHCPETDASA